MFLRQSRAELITRADASRVSRVFSGVCVLVCLSDFPHDISKSDVARITKLDLEMFHYECLKPINFRIKRSKVKVKVKVTKHKKLPAWVMALL